MAIPRLFDQILASSWWRWLLLLLAIAFFLRCPVFLYPFFNGDEATYSAIANSMLHGNTLYSSVVDHKPPMIYLTYALILGLFSRYCIAVVQLVSILVIVLTALVLGRVCSSAGRPLKEQRLAALAYVIFSTMGPGKDMLAANAEIFMLLPTVIAVWFFTGKKKAASLLVAGFLCSLAFLYKYQGGAILGALTFTVVLTRDRLWVSRLHQLVLLGLGFLLPISALFFTYLVNDNMASLHFWGWTFPSTYAGMLPTQQIVYNGVVKSLQWGLPNSVLLFAAGIGMRALQRDQINRSYRLLLMCWLLWSALAVASGGRFTLHYYIQLLPPLVLLAAVGFHRLFPATPKTEEPLDKHGKMPVPLCIILVLLPLFLFWTANIFDHRLRSRVDRYTTAYKSVGAWIKEQSNKEDTIFVWGNSPEIYYFSQRIMGTRFVFCNYQSGKIWGTSYDEEGAGDTQKMSVKPTWHMLSADINNRRPQWIIDAAAGGLDRWRGHEIPRYPALWRLIAADYQLVGEVAGTTIYRRHTEKRPERPTLKRL